MMSSLRLPSTPTAFSRRGRASTFRARGTTTAAAASLPSSGSSFYTLLGVPELGSVEEIKRAYKKMARRCHPDVCPPEMAEECTRRFIELKRAYETLSDPRSRKAYDSALLRGGLNIAFNSTKGRSAHETSETTIGFRDKSEWRNYWQRQVSELQRKSMNKDSENSTSWGSRMRRRRADEDATAAAG